MNKIALIACPPPRTNIDRSKNYRKNAFTLAEVLITLGIIGIVAALTLPTLVSNHQKKVAVTRLKTAYSQISQAILLAQAKSGDTENWERDAEKILFEYIAPNIKSEQFKHDIEHDYQHTMCKNNQTYKFLDGSGMGSPFASMSPSIKFINGTCISLNRISDPNTKQINLFIDINGTNPPNINGKDLFVFLFDLHESKITTIAANYEVENLLTGNTMGFCNKKAKFGGTHCSTVIMKSGWEIPNSYPW